MLTAMRCLVSVVLLVLPLGCGFDAGSVGTEVAPGSSGTTVGSGSTALVMTESAGTASSTAGGTVGADGNSSSSSASTDTTGGGSSSSGAATPEECNGVDDDGDGLVDEPSPTNLECDDCTSVILDGIAFTTCTAELSWADARARCMMLGGDLASFDDLAQQQTVVATGTGDRWIGLTDAAREGTWTWADGSPLAYTDWRATEPDDWPPGEDCGQIRGGDEGWGDATCDSMRDYVCEVVVD